MAEDLAKHVSGLGCMVVFPPAQYYTKTLPSMCQDLAVWRCFLQCNITPCY